MSGFFEGQESIFEGDPVFEQCWRPSTSLAAASGKPFQIHDGFFALRSLNFCIHCRPRRFWLRAPCRGGCRGHDMNHSGGIYPSIPS